MDTRKMADVTSLFPHLRVSNSYIPTSPPKPPKATTSYSRSVQDAPYSALSGVVKDGRIPERQRVMPRCRERHQVGATNRWRLPESLYSDLLGNAQALKAINMPYNSSMIRIITAESPKMCTNLESNAPYSFRRSLPRPQTTPGSVVVGPSSHQHQPASTAAVTTTTTLLQPRGFKDGSPSIPRLTVRSKSCLPAPVGPVKTFVPKAAHYRTPKDLFLYHSKKSNSFVGPAEQKSTYDVLLKCLEMDWELHRPYLQKSQTLALQLTEVDDPSLQNYYRSPAAQILDDYISNSRFYSNDYKDSGESSGRREKEEEGLKPLDHPAHISERRTGRMSVLQLEVTDPLVTKRAMAIALGNLYHDDLDVDLSEVAGVLAAACILGFKQLIDGCADIMLKSVNYHTVCRYHLAASKYHQEHIILACERWLELSLIPKLSMQIQLREISTELLQKIIKSSRLFVYNEYSVYRTLAYWLFLQLNPDIQLVPSHSTVLSFFNRQLKPSHTTILSCFNRQLKPSHTTILSCFNSLPKRTSFLECDEGRIYVPLFQSIRLHGITDTCNIQDMQQMNLLPQAWLISVLSQHYHALQGGGDMTSVRDFHTSAVRQGFIVDDEPHYHSEVLSLHGFHFELKAVREDVATCTYVISMERLKHGDPMLSFRQCERHTFSMRPDREVRYCMTVQGEADSRHYITTTGILTHNFGLGQKTCRSQVLKLSNLKEPVHVSFSLLFPPS